MRITYAGWSPRRRSICSILAPESLGDGVVLLLEALQAPVELVEAPEDLVAELIEAMLETLEAAVDGLEHGGGGKCVDSRAAGAIRRRRSA